jgi:hypothetical protein
MAGAICFRCVELLQEKTIDAGDEIRGEVAGDVEARCVLKPVFGGICCEGENEDEKENQSLLASAATKDSMERHGLGIA